MPVRPFRGSCHGVPQPDATTGCDIHRLCSSWGAGGSTARVPVGGGAAARVSVAGGAAARVTVAGG